MKKLVILMMVMTLVFGLSIASFAISTNGGTETMEINATLDPFGQFHVMNGGCWNLTLKRDHFGDHTYLKENFLRLRLNAPVTVAATFGPLVGQVHDFSIGYQMNFKINNQTLATINSANQSASWQIPLVWGSNYINGEWFADVELIPALPDNWYDLPADTYSTEIVFTISLD